MLVSQQPARPSYGSRPPDSAMRSRLGNKPYRVEWIGEPGAALATFEDLRAAIRHVGGLRLDQQHIVIHGDDMLLIQAQAADVPDRGPQILEGGERCPRLADPLDAIGFVAQPAAHRTVGRATAV